MAEPYVWNIVTSDAPVSQSFVYRVPKTGERSSQGLIASKYVLLAISSYIEKFKY